MDGYAESGLPLACPAPKRPPKSVCPIIRRRGGHCGWKLDSDYRGEAFLGEISVVPSSEGVGSFNLHGIDYSNTMLLLKILPLGILNRL